MRAKRGIKVRQVAVAGVRENDVARVAVRLAMSLLVIAVALGILLVAPADGVIDTGVEHSDPDDTIVIGTGHITLDRSDCYVVPEGETREVDLYIWARCIEIVGTLDGDIVAGFQDGEISGVVTQDLNGACETMTISGEVGDDVRFACETFYVTGRVGGDLIVAAKDVQISEGAVIEGDVIIASGTATIDGRIGGRARIITGYVDIGGTIDGNAEITTDGGIRFSEDARIGGDLFYEGPSRMDIPEGVVAGMTNWQYAEPKEFDDDFDFPAVGIFFHLLGFIAAIVAGSIIVALTSDHARRTAEIIRTKPLKSLGIGFVTYICMPIVLLVLLVLIITIPLMAVVTLCYLAALYIAKFYVAIWLGNLILQRGGRTDVSPVPSMLLGLVLVYAVTAIPIFGTIVGIVIIFFGLGALLQRKETRLDAAFEPAPPAAPNALPNGFSGTGTGA